MHSEMSLKITLVLFFVSVSCSHVPRIFKNIEIPKTDLHLNTEENSHPESKFDIQQKIPGFHIRLPFIDMEIENKRNLLIMQEQIQKADFFIVHGNELFQMFIDRKEKRLSLVGYLSGSLEDDEPLSGEIIMWHDFFLLVIAMDEYVEIYEIPKSLTKERSNITKDPKRMNETAPTFDPIQQISLLGRYRQHILTDPDKEHIMLIIGINFTKLYGRLHTFIWMNTYFEPAEELTVPPLHLLSIVGTYPKYLIRGRFIQHQTKTIITVQKIQAPAMMLSTTQTITANSRIVHAVSFHNKNHLIACSIQQKHCSLFHMNSEGRFHAYQHRPSQDLSFDKVVGGRNLLVATRRNQVLIYENSRMDCFGSFITNETDIKSIQTLINTYGESFILLQYKRPFRTLIRFVEIELKTRELLGTSGINVTEVEDSSILFHHRHMFEETIGMLRSLLLRRRNAMNAFHRIPPRTRIQPLRVEVLHPVRLKAGNIEVIKIVDQRLVTPMQLLQHIEEMRQKFVLQRGKRATQNSTLSSLLKVKNLKVMNFAYEGSIIKGFDLERKATPSPILVVRPKLTAKKLIGNKLLTRQKSMNTSLHDTSHNTTLSILKLNNLNVEYINKVPWREFYDPLFLKNRDYQIKGNLTVKASTRTSNLTCRTLNGKAVESLFNLEQPQKVNSNIEFFGFFIRELHVDILNDLDFANDIVFQNSNDSIETPVNMHQLNIVKDLLLDENITVVRKEDDGENDFVQHYTGRVIINGSLTVANLGTERRGHVFINGMPFTKAYIEKKFLLRNQSQTFSSDVSFGNAKVTIPSLTTNSLNGSPMEDHLLANATSNITQSSVFVFANARIEGNLEKNTLPTRIANLSRNAVRRGDVANITGNKIFTAPLTVDHALTLSLNQLKVNDFLLKSQLKQGFQFEHTKSFNRVLVSDYIRVHKALNATNLNENPTNELFSQDYHIDMLRVPFRLNAKNIVFQKINDIGFDDVFKNFKLRDDELVLHKELIIDGNVNFSEDLNLEHINGIDWHAYQTDLVNRNDNAVITGNKIFVEELSITKVLRTPKLNELNMEEVFTKILSKSRQQTIEGTYTFQSLKLTHVDVAAINGISITEFIDLRTQKLQIDGDVILPKITVFGNASTDEIHEWMHLQFFAEQIKQLPNLFWRNIVVTENAFLHATEGYRETQLEPLNYLYRYGIRRDGQQVITGNVRLFRPFITKMRTSGTFSNDIDFDFDVFAKDCIFKSAQTKQVISVEKTFLKPLHMQDMKTKSYFGAPLVNGVDVIQLNRTLYYLSNSESILGPINFITPPKISRITLRGLVNGAVPLGIFHNSSEILPPVMIKRLIVEDSLKISDINDISLNHLLAQRIVKKGVERLELTGTLHFENLMLNERAFLQSINGLHIDKLVFKQSEHLQAITSAKTFERSVILKGPVHVMRLNDMDLIESYQQNNKLRIKDVALEEEGFIPAITSTRKDAENRELSLQSKITELEMKLDEIDGLLNEKSRNYKGLLYLDYAESLPISWRAPDSNVSLYKNVTIELKKITLCERRYLKVQISQVELLAAGVIFLSNFTTNLITSDHKNINVRAENYCHHKYRRVKSKITFTGGNFTRIIGIKRYIKQIIIFSPDNQDSVFVLLHSVDSIRNRNEVRILKIINSQEFNIIDWQSLNMGIGKTLRLFENTDYVAVISGGGMIDYHPATVIYHFDFTTQKFIFVQSIDGDFDIHELLPIKFGNNFQLILSCRQCQRVHIYSYYPSEIERPYQIFQILKLKTLIGRMQPFRVNDGSCYLLFLAENGQGYYYLYRFSPLQGWIHVTYGYLEDVEMTVPLTNTALELAEPHLLALLCGSKICTLLKAVIV